jgi:hypothetical protein
MNQENPFENDHRKNVMNELLSRGLVKRITIIEGNYPTQKEQRDFLERIMEWLRGKRRNY